MDFFVFSLNFIVDVTPRYEFIFFNKNIFVDRDLLDLFYYLSLFDYLLFNCSHFYYFLFNSVGVDNFVNEFINYFIASNKDWLFGCDFNEFGYLYCFLHDLLDFVNFRYLVYH